MNDVAQEVLSHRTKICTAFLVTYAIFSIPVIGISLLRIPDIGWQPVMLVHVVTGVMLWAVVLFHKKLPYNFKAAYLIMMFLVVGVGGIVQFGMAAGSVALLVVAGPLATLLFGARAGFFVLCVTLGAALTTAYLAVSGAMSPSVDIVSYVTGATTWGTSLVTWTFASTGMAISLHVFNKSLITSLQASQIIQEALKAKQQELEATIAEKDAALAEIQTLHGIIPICSYCHDIRTDEGAWDDLEHYISTHSDAQFTHGVCPTCFDKLTAGK